MIYSLEDSHHTLGEGGGQISLNRLIHKTETTGHRTTRRGGGGVGGIILESGFKA